MIYGTLIIDVDSAEQWREIERELYRRGHNWPETIGDVGNTAEEQLEAGYSHGPMPERQIVVNGKHQGGLSHTLSHAKYPDDTDEDVVSGENFLRHTDRLL